MPRNSRQKLKLLYLKDYLLANTDENHAVTVSDMKNYLESCGIPAERKSLYDDIDTLREAVLTSFPKSVTEMCGITWYRANLSCPS